MTKLDPRIVAASDAVFPKTVNLDFAGLTVKERLIEFCASMNLFKMPTNHRLTFTVGRRYFKIIHHTHPEAKSGSAWGFVDKVNGDLFKAAGWNTPAKTARGNIFDADILDQVEWTGPRYLK